MISFQDILGKAKPGKVVVAPRPAPALSSLLDQLKEAGQELTVKEDFSPAVLKEIQQGFEQGKWDVFLQGDISLKDFFEPLADGGMNLERMGFVSLFEDRSRHKLLFVVDTYMQNRPSFRAKTLLLEMTINLAGSLGVEQPRVAVLSALETVNPAMISSIEAAALSKMADRGQFAAVVEGPLDIDSALSSEAAQRKGVLSPVPGEVDILLCPEIESGYALSCFLSGLGKMPVAGVLLGAPLPIIIQPEHIPLLHKDVELAVASLRKEMEW